MSGTDQPPCFGETGTEPGPALSFHEIAESGKRRSALRTYRELVLGHPSVPAWIRYETLVTLLTFLPGAAGLLLRQKLFPFLFHRCGPKPVFGCGLGLRQPDRMDLGAGSILDDYCALTARGGDGVAVELGDRVYLGRHSAVTTRNGRVVVGADTSVGSSCRLSASEGELRIGRHGLIAAFCYLGGGAHRFDRIDIPMARQGNISKGGVVVEDDCWIGAGTIVMDGARIGQGSIIGAGSVVIGEIPPYSIAYGSPAKVQRSRKPDEVATVPPPDKGHP